MADIVDSAVRSQMMAGIRSKNTKSEIIVRKALFSLGWRYRLHSEKLPGKPDIVFPRQKAVIFINGCFWHGHNCHLFKMPTTRGDFWQQKIASNRKRDNVVHVQLQEAGYRSLTVWECSLRGKTKLQFDELIRDIDFWLKSSELNKEIQGYTDVRGHSD